MNNLNPDNFEELLNVIRANIDNYTKCDNIRSIESNFNTKSMIFNSIGIPSMDGTIIIGEDNGYIAVDISLANGQVISFNLKNANDLEGIRRISDWFKGNYRQ
ncbi:MAG: hypothetical protein K0R09_1501 [Clostridiales bacterium]|jgi:hypothetical protein|nr:hypothetical protein [Clostridiales bacterium]